MKRIIAFSITTIFTLLIIGIVLTTEMKEFRNLVRRCMKEVKECVTGWDECQDVIESIVIGGKDD